MAIKVSGYAPRITWDNLPGKPTAFVPVAHTHAWSQITDTPTQYPPAAHTHAFSEITGKPSAYPPIGHTHLWADITDKPTTFAPALHTHAWTEITGKPTSFTPSSHTHAWNDITGKPTAFPPSTHTHIISDITGLQSALDALAERKAILTYAGADLTWTYPTPFASGVVPLIQALAVPSASSTALFNVQLVGDPTNTSCKIRVNTIPAASVSLLGLINLNLFQQAPSGVKIHIRAVAQ